VGPSLFLQASDKKASPKPRSLWSAAALGSCFSALRIPLGSGRSSPARIDFAVWVLPPVHRAPS
jgi:hypothetical protein